MLESEQQAQVCMLTASDPPADRERLQTIEKVHDSMVHGDQVSMLNQSTHVCIHVRMYIHTHRRYVLIDTMMTHVIVLLSLSKCCNHAYAHA
jgi:hypothetical protein